ncbi:transcription regulator [Drepanopeziza brunnea f. sp. 'multigermtubi' MB_m1]|uniref:Transcription regulator n=1 Tax=Marssonina brunnea f. sp. multigermtubi (strain MB_m1) TaxID=1072389 RepID=K1XRS4_MARBU|nr:transcription regulator [Drepanopeziza brunnea f. sp. 'multigermtubi' MB_m1]EKD15299.1 transcription regulator [Drepanopeziza brunnea f. sp. 'multigermtubi' MB_m1]
MSSQHSERVAFEQKTQPVPSDDKMALDLDINGASPQDETTLNAEPSEPLLTKSAPSPLAAADPLEMPEVNGSANVSAFAANQEVAGEPINPSVESQTAKSSSSVSALPPSTDTTTTTTEAQVSVGADSALLESTTQISPADEAVEAAVDHLSAPTAVLPVIESQESDLRHTSPSAQSTQATTLDPDLDPNSAQLPTPQPEKESEVASISADVSDLTFDQPQAIPEPPLDLQNSPPPPASAAIDDPNFTSPEQAIPPDTMVNDTEMLDAPQPESTSAKIAREREDDDEMEPSAKRPKTEDESMADEAAPTPNGEAAERTTGTPISPYQVQQLSQALKSACKNRNGLNFRGPVVELWPDIKTNYLSRISKPIDLKTMDHKLTSGVYRFMEEFTSDLHLLYNNTLTFNGQFHDVSKAAFVIRGNLLNKIENTPSEPIKAPKRDKKAKRSSPAPNTASRAPKPRQESRDPLPAPSHSAAPAPTFALDPTTSMPLIRRDSTKADGGRPKREIHPPKSKDLVYAHPSRPKNKKHSTELKFCEMVLEEVRKDRYAQFNHIFQFPVDPVALNIPTYFTIIKKPMDLSTMSNKLKSGSYGNASEFEKDMRLMLANCYKFNPPPNMVNELGKRFEELFNKQWEQKDQWVHDHAPAAASPASMPESEDEDDEEDDDDASNNASKNSLGAAKNILLEHQQKLIALMSAKNRDEFVISMQQDLVATVQKRVQAEEDQVEKRKGKKLKSSKAPKKAVAAPKRPVQPKKPPKPKFMGSLEKEVISAGLMDLPDDVSLVVLDKIKRERPGIDPGEDGTLELDIDVISLELLWEIYHLIMHHRPEVLETVKSAMQERESPRVVAKAAPTKKKNKPMSKEAQEQNIKALQQKLGTYERASSGSHSQEPVLQTVEQTEDMSSGDESDSEEE